MLTRGSQPAAEGVDTVTLARDQDNDAVKTTERYQPGILPRETFSRLKRTRRREETRQVSLPFVRSVGRFCYEVGRVDGCDSSDGIYSAA